MLMRYIIILFVISILLPSIGSGLVTPTDSEIDAVSREINHDIPSIMSRPRHNEPLITINTDSLLDMNWRASMDFTDVTDKAGKMHIPILQHYKINDLEIKVRVLDVYF